MSITAKEARNIALLARKREKLAAMERKKRERADLRKLRLKMQKIAPEISENIFDDIKGEAMDGNLEIKTRELCEYIGVHSELFGFELQYGWKILPGQIRTLIKKRGFEVKVLPDKNTPRQTRFQISY